jgi:hypothetical protein
MEKVGIGCTAWKFEGNQNPCRSYSLQLTEHHGIETTKLVLAVFDQSNGQDV